MVKLATIQLSAKPMDLPGNYAKAEQYIRQAAEQGARLAVIPEYFLTSWVPEHPDFAGAFERENKYIVRFCGLAKELNINLVPGTFVERGTCPDDKETTLDNNAYFISNEGKVLGKYTKKNLWHTEREHLDSSATQPHEVIETPEFGKIGILICWDLAFPEAFRELVSKGARIIIITSYWTAGTNITAARRRSPRHDALFIDTCLQARAFENDVVVIFSNIVGKSEVDYGGCSQITVPLLGKIAGAKSDDEELVIADVDMSILEEAEECYKVWPDLERPNFHYPRMSDQKQPGCCKHAK